MNNLNPTKHDRRHGRITMPDSRIFGVRTTKNGEKNGVKEELEALSGVKLKYELHRQPFLCLNPKNNQFKKKT